MNPQIAMNNTIYVGYIFGIQWYISTQQYDMGVLGDPSE